MKSSPKIKEIKDNLKLLSDQKIALLKNMISSEEQFNELSTNILETEEWMFGLSIRSLNDLSSRRSRLGDWKKRIKLRKTNQKSLSNLESLNTQIKLAKLELLSAKVDLTLSEPHEI